MLLLAVPCVAQTYDLPNDDNGCPANCRQIPWVAGSDVWNNGILPTYTGVPCTGLTEGNGTTDNTSAIQACLSSLSTGQAAVVPPGIYYVNGTITLKSGAVLRGSGSINCSQGRWLSSTFPGDTGGGAACTTLKLGTSGAVRFASTPSPGRGSNIPILSGYTKGSRTLTVGSGHGLVTGDWVAVYEQPDSAVPVTASGTNGVCDWCGESDNTNRLMSQFVQVTVSGNTLTLNRPLYYTFKSGLSPGLRKYSFQVNRAGLEDLKLHGWSDSRTRPIIDMSNSFFSWVRSVEAYRDTNSAKGFPIYAQYIYGNEIRDSYIHGQRANSSDKAYGIGLMFTTSDNKIENNIIREQRHGGSQESGGSGNVWLYNYIDDIYYIYDLSWMDAARGNHGAHPYFTLYEGNIANKFGSDFTWGSASHMVLFRNWFWGDLTGNYSGYSSNNPNWGFDAVSIDRNNNYFSLVGNVLGNPNLHTNWAAATIYPGSACTYGSRSRPVVYQVGCDDDQIFNANTWNTMIRHGNYDFKTQGVAEWGGGANHALAPSMYYASRPAFFGNCSWPAFGPDVSGITSTQPAKNRFEGGTVCTGTGPGTPPAPPTNLRILSSTE
jgi:hypothetical protein